MSFKRLIRKEAVIKDAVTIAKEFMQENDVDRSQMAFDPTYASKYFEKFIAWLKKNYKMQYSQQLVYQGWNYMCGQNAWAATFPTQDGKTDKDYNLSGRPGPFM